MFGPGMPNEVVVTIAQPFEPARSSAIVAVIEPQFNVIGSPVTGSLTLMVTS